MKAFLSHSSKDKSFVGQVATLLGLGQVEYDEKTFEFTLNVEAIHRALARCDLFVFFLSANSLSSTFVTEEQRAALEGRGRGIIKRVLVFAIDNTSYRALPDWLKQINVVQQLSSPKTCARRIQSTLLELDASEGRSSEIYIGREDEEKALRRALSAPPSSTPVAIHAVGHQGIGRRTFLRRSIQNVYPRVFDVFVEISVAKYQGIEELFRSIYDLHVVSSLSKTIEDFDAFSKEPYQQQISILVQMITEMNSNGEFILVIDDGGIYDEQGDYQQHFKDLISQLSRSTQPMLGFIQNRMMPFSRRQEYSRSYHVRLQPLNDEAVAELLSLSLKEYKIDFTFEDISNIAAHLDGHPFNVRFAVRFISEYGVKSLIDDPSDLVEWKRRRAEDFLNKLQFSSLQIDLISILAEYRYVATDMLLALIEVDSAEVASNLRLLEEFCCVERREGYYHVSPPIRDAVRRDKRFAKSDDWKRSIGAKICKTIEDYKDDDFVTVRILEVATMAAAQSSVPSNFLSHLILPSHLLRIARDFYDNKKFKLCTEFCQRAYGMKDRLPNEAQVEVLRLWGLSAVRLNSSEGYDSVLNALKGYTGKVAKRVSLFLQGFRFRLRGELDQAEQKLLEAWKISRDNQSINRELASLYCKQRRYSDAEAHARAVYQIAPTNPFIIDILAETLLGKMQTGLYVDREEVDHILKELRTYGDAPGSSFYLIRDAQQRMRDRDYEDAMKSINRAVERTPALLAPYFIRAELFLRMNNISGAERDLAEIERMLADAGGLSEGDEAQAQELEIKILIEKRQFRFAKEKIERSHLLSKRSSNRLFQQLAKAIAYMPDEVDNSLRAWAKDFSQQEHKKG